MQPWETEVKQQNIPLRKSAKAFIKNSVFAIACVNVIYACVLKKAILDSIKSKHSNN
tara:strand:+ start:8448 stop:8618 length:171 start_codon:yes stop_codon:yes gene_type:complete